MRCIICLNHADAAHGLGVSQNVFLEAFSLTKSGLRAWITLDNLLERYEIRRHTLEASLLYILAEKNLSNLIAIHLEKIPNIDIMGERCGTPIHAALFNDNERAVRAILSADAKNSSNSDKPQSTFFAVKSKRHEDAISFLVQEKDDIEFNAQPGQTLLSYAAQKGHEIIVELLLDTGMVDVESRDRNGRTPLCIAAIEGHDAVVRLLLEHHADVAAKDEIGGTPLH